MRVTVWAIIGGPGKFHGHLLRDTLASTKHEAIVRYKLRTGRTLKSSGAIAIKLCGQYRKRP